MPSALLERIQLVHPVLSTPATVSKTDTIRALVEAAVLSFANGFKWRHIWERDDPEGTINMKIHNVFIAVLGEEIQYYTALARSLDSSMGNMLEWLAISIAKLSYEVTQHVEWEITNEQTGQIATLLERYKRHEKRPEIIDYQNFRIKATVGTTKRHESDYMLTDPDTGAKYLIELKIWGDLDNKKARSEKEALLEQYVILSNTLPASTPVYLKFATAYNRFGEWMPWRQERVRQFFADDELLIWADFWNFICKDVCGYEVVLDAYKSSAHHIKKALEEVKTTYLD